MNDAPALRPRFMATQRLHLSPATMSIAVSAMIRPSRLLRAAQALLCALVLACGVIVEQRAASAVLLAAAMAGAACNHRIVKPARIDISGVGQLRVTVYHHVDVPRPVSMRLMPGTTLWPGLLLLRLQVVEVPDGARPAGGGACWLAVLPDSAAPDVRRRLALAVRAIATRN